MDGAETTPGEKGIIVMLTQTEIRGGSRGHRLTPQDDTLPCTLFHDTTKLIGSNPIRKTEVYGENEADYLYNVGSVRAYKALENGRRQIATSCSR